MANIKLHQDHIFDVGDLVYKEWGRQWEPARVLKIYKGGSGGIKIQFVECKRKLDVHRQTLKLPEAFQAENKTVLEEQKRAAEAERIVEEQKRVAEAERIVEEQKRVAEAESILEEEKRVAEAESILEEQKKAAEAESILEEQMRAAETESILEEQKRVAEAESILEEQKRVAEAESILEEQKRVVEAESIREKQKRVAETERVLEEQKRATEAESILEEQNNAAEEMNRLQEERNLMLEQQIADGTQSCQYSIVNIHRKPVTRSRIVKVKKENIEVEADLEDVEQLGENVDPSRSTKPPKSKKTKNKAKKRKNVRINVREEQNSYNLRTLDEALELATTVSSDEIDVVILPPDGVESDTEMIDDNDGNNLPLSAVKDTAGTYELHFVGEESDNELDTEQFNNTAPITRSSTDAIDNKYPDILAFRSEVQNIVKDTSTDTSEKINKLLELCPKIKNSCKWVADSAQAPNLLPRPSHSEAVVVNRSKLIQDFGGLLPHEILERLIDDPENSLLEHIVKESERYAHSRFGDLTFKTNKDEIKTFIGVLLLSGYHKLPQAHLYWDSNVDTNVSVVTDAVSRNRYNLLKKYIHCVDNRDVDTTDKYWKVRPLYDIMNQSLAKFKNLDNTYSIDEQMVPYTGMHSAKQRMKDKSIRFGYKNFWLVGSSGFPYHCLPYCGKKGIGGDPGKNLTSRVTIQLAMKILEPKESNVFYDNWFASYKLLAIFSAMELGASCTIQSQRTNSCPTKTDSALKKEGRGSFSKGIDEFTGVTIVKWHDNNVVNVGSNIFTVNPIADVERYSQSEKKKIQIKRPSLVREYNKGMGNVDVFDGHVASYRISLRGKKWWWPHFINTLDCLKAASYSLYEICHCNEKTKLTYLNFIRRITIAYLKKRLQPPSSLCQRVAVWKGDNRVTPEVRLESRTNTHWPVKTKQRRCALNGCKGRSNYKCEVCDVALCVLCFKPYHQLT